MAQGQDNKEQDHIQGALLDDRDYLRGIVERVLQQVLESEAAKQLGAQPYQRTSGRVGHRNGHYSRKDACREVGAFYTPRPCWSVSNGFIQQLSA